jgi:hypothetical protein
MIAKPMADSAAATVIINKEKICPTTSSRKTENVTKFKFIDSNINSIDIIINKIFFLFKIIPNVTIRKIIVDKII